jgi:hypothetical protein
MKFVWVPSISRFLRTETEAKKQKLAYEVVEYETDKDSLIDRFNRYEERLEQVTLGGHTAAETPTVESEQEPEASVTPPPQPKAPAPPSYTDWSIAIDDVWDKLPLARKLHFAADAMECARDAIPEAKSQVDRSRGFAAPSPDGADDRPEPLEEAAA